MGRLIPTAGGHIALMEGTKRVWSSDGAPAYLLPESDWFTVNAEIKFPDFIKRNANIFIWYHDPLLDVDLTSCVSWSTILPGEWGYNRAEPRTLPDKIIGTVPAGVNHLEVKVKLSRSKSPTSHASGSIANLLGTNWVQSSGNSFTCEELGTIFKRGFDVRLSGQNVVLRRYQSVAGEDNGIAWLPDNTEWTGSGGRRSGWTYGGGSGAQNGILFRVIQSKGPGGNINKERGGSNACSLVDNSDYSSTYTGQIVVMPGFIRT